MIAILNYNMGNLFSVEKKLKSLGTDVLVTSQASDLLKAEKLILPGVGHFGKAMDQLRSLDLIDVLQEAVVEHKKPILGICLGMQLMTQGSEEGGVEGLGWFSCSTERMRVQDSLRYKIPHTGWNSIEHPETDSILNHVPSGSEMYFVHAYGVLKAKEEEVLCTTHYEQNFVSALKKDHIIGMQFHPEKSHDGGLQVFKNFIAV